MERTGGLDRITFTVDSQRGGFAVEDIAAMIGSELKAHGLTMTPGSFSLEPLPIPQEPLPEVEHVCFMCKEECDCGTSDIRAADPFSRGCHGCRRCVVDGPPGGQND